MSGSLRLSPRDTIANIWMTYAGSAKNQLGSYELAIAWFHRAIRANRNFPLTQFSFAVALAQLGRGAFSGQSRPRAQPVLHHLPRPRQLVGDKRRPDVSLLARVRFDGTRKAGVPERQDRGQSSSAATAVDVVG